MSGGPNGVVLRQYRTGDLEAMYALDLTCFEPVFQFSRRAMRRFAEAAGAVTVVAETQAEREGEARLAGFTIVQMERQTGYVVTLDVAPAWRRRGLARRLMEEAEALVRAGGGVGMELHVFVGNLAALELYESMGYGRTGRADDFYARGMDALLYAKRL